MDADIVIVGAGFSGTVAAYNLTAQGINTILIDHVAEYPDAFRAEKLEPNQAEALQRLSMLEYRQPCKPPIGGTINYRDGKRSAFDTQEQYGMHYGNTVNSFRRALQPETKLLIEKVTDIRLSDDIQTVITSNRQINCRLVILASGGRDVLIRKAGIKRRNHSSLTSLSFAFNIIPASGQPFAFNGFNYFLSGETGGIDYATIFRIGEIMRVNIFTQWATKSSKVKNLKQDPVTEMNRYFPDMVNQIGEYEASTKVQAFPTQFYRLKGAQKHGAVVIGDDYQSVCPATGTGLDKVTTDVERLCHHYIPRWLKSPGMEKSKISQFYKDAEKQNCDDNSLEKWISYRDNHRGFWGQQMSKLEIRWKKAFGLW